MAARWPRVGTRRRGNNRWLERLPGQRRGRAVDAVEELEPHYTEAEALFHVHGARGEDRLEPWASVLYAHPPVRARVGGRALSERLKGIGLHPFHPPLGILLDEQRGKPTPVSTFSECSYFEGFPCLLNGKADAQVMYIDPMLASYPNVTLLTGAYVSRLETDPSRRRVETVHVMREGREEQYCADIVVVAAGALSSALLLLRSVNPTLTIVANALRFADRIAERLR